MLRKDRLADIEALRAAVDGASSTAEVLRRLHLRVCSENYDAVRVACATNHISLPPKGSRSPGPPKRSLDEMLVMDSPVASRTVKRRLIQDGVLDDVCAKCGQEPWWNGEPLVLQLEHINGIHNDNRLENLCILCPNCHTQTATYAGANGKRVPAKVYVCECGLPRGRNSKMCRSCYLASARR